MTRTAPFNQAQDAVELLWSLACMQRYQAAGRLTRKTLEAVAGAGGGLSLQHHLLLEWSLGALATVPVRNGSVCV